MPNATGVSSVTSKNNIPDSGKERKPLHNASVGKKYLYDIVNIKENTASALDLQNREIRSTAYKAVTRGNVSADNIPDSVEKSKL